MNTCPICTKELTAFVTLECKHTLCLGCYHNCLYHNHTKCSLCRKVIPELEETCDLVKSLENDVEDNETEIDELKVKNQELETFVNELTDELVYYKERQMEIDFEI